MKDKFDIEKNKISKEQLFEVPEGYFEQLEEEVLSKTVDKKKQGGNGVFKQIKWFYWPVAATLLLGIVLAYFQLNDLNGVESKGKQQDFLSEVSNEEILEYLEYEDVDMQLYDYAVEAGVSVDAEQYIDIDLSEEELYDELETSDLEEIYL